LNLGQILLSIWALLFVWYVLERLRVVREQQPERPLWHNPIAAARAFWRSLWDHRGLAWGTLATVVGGYLLVCLGGFLGGLMKHGRPTSIADTPIRRLLDVRVGEFTDLLLHPKFWGMAWREMLDGLTLYPAFEMGLGARAITGLVILALVVWIARNRDEVLPPERIDPRQVKETLSVLAAGLAALLAWAAVAMGDRRADAQAFLSVTSLIADPVVHGGALGLVSLIFADIVLALPLRAAGLARRWVRTLPTFALLAAAPVLCRVVADSVLPGWETDRQIGVPNLAATLWLLTRLAWVGVLPLWLWVTFERRGLRGAVDETRVFWGRHWRAVLVALARSCVILAPLLVAVDVMSTIAPPSALLPGVIPVLISWMIGLATLGGAMQVYRVTRSVSFGRGQVGPHRMM